MKDQPTVRKKTFSYEEAVALLPEVRRLTEAAHTEVMALGTREDADARARIDAALEAWARRLAEMGIEVKGVWLVDFDNGSGYYCWQYPEPGLHYFHSYEDGFRGRVRIH